MRKRQNPIFNLFNISSLIISLIGSAVTVTPAWAASIVVNSTADDTLANLALNPTCDLREAVAAAASNIPVGACPAGWGAATITFSDTLGTATITLVDFLPYSSSSEMIIDGGSDITISGNNSHRVFYNYGIMTLENITITEGSNASGGAINNAGTLNINNSTFTDNHAGFDGGAIFNAGTLTITNSSFTNNSAGRYGGAIEHYSNNFHSGNLLNATITSSTFTANSAEYGGAITSNDVIDIIKSAFSGNQASNSGGAIYNLYSSAIVTGSTFTNNFARSNGGAFFKSNPYFTSSITGSTFTGNHADLAGGSVYVDAGTLNITNSTLYNSYTDFAGAGGGFYNRATLNIRNVTVSNSNANSGGGIFNTGGTINLYNSIIANTTGGGDCSSDSGTVNAGNNLLEDAANFCGIPNDLNNNIINNIVGVDPKLSALANNGGPTQTMELDPTSDAIDNGDDTICNAAPVNNEDQRGIARPQGAGCDIGAFEVDGPPDVTVNQASGQADPTNTSPIKFTVVFDEPIDITTFTDADLSYTGSTAPGTFSALITEVAPNNGTTFEIEVSGMTGSGNVVLSIEAGNVQDLGGNDNNASTSTDNIVAYEIDAPIVLTTSLQAAYTDTGPNTFTVTFSEEVNNAGGGLDADDAANVNNYLVVEDGLDGTFQTLDCLSGLAGDDTKATVTSVSLFAPPPTALVTLSAPLGVGNYRLFVCGTTSITDLTGNHLNGGTDFTFDFVVAASTGTGTTGGTGSGESTITASALPKTGFAPNRLTTLPAQPTDLTYANLGELWLEIPSLNVKTTIVGVPRSGEDWELNWLGNDTGWLNGTAFPTWTGNSVLTAHVTNADGLPGPFAELGKLKYGDQVIVHMGGGMYVYEIRNTRLARPYSTSFAFESLQDHSYLTLITCQFYNPLNDSYMFRRVVRAVLVSAENE